MSDEVRSESSAEGEIRPCDAIPDEQTSLAAHCTDNEVPMLPVRVQDSELGVIIVYVATSSVSIQTYRRQHHRLAYRLTDDNIIG